MNINMQSYSLLSSDYLVSHYIWRLLRLWQVLWRVTWLIFGWLMAILSITADQFYLNGWKEKSIEKIELAALLFPIERDLALGSTYYYLLSKNPTELTIAYLD